eukprot:NODE_22029_length_725_cov_8.341137.p2 GENE.NODE_22029_length_725_cov_8.341137~~NODE_22029_length_725_cov_8.341137.p2  ORF type:complete len:158 (+),score=35.94 NODE_22029_length_725_cov_8.341137:111-584(+)
MQAPLPKVPFVRAWGVLASWFSDGAREVLMHGIRPADIREDVEDAQEREAHAARRRLLRELLTERVSGELSFLAPRFNDIISALSVHHPLPCVTEHDLYDLLAAVLLRAIFRADMQRLGDRDTYSERLLERQLEDAAHRAGVAPDEVEAIATLTESC